MEQITDRRAQILEYLSSYMEGCFQKSCNVIQIEIESYANNIWKGLRSCINECLNNVRTMQENQSKGKLQYLVFSFLQCEVYFDRLELRVDFFDNSFYLDEQEVASYYYPEFLQEKYVEDVKSLQKKAAEKFVRLQNYELIDIKQKYAGFYGSILCRMLESLTEVIWELINDSTVQIEEDFKIIFGGYMDNAKVLYKGASLR